MNKSLIVVVLTLVALACAGCTTLLAPPGSISALGSVGATSSGDAAIARAFTAHSSGVEVSGQGVVTRVLADDNQGDRHQRFILRLGSGQTLLFAHNIDIAPRLASLKPGSVVAFRGIYEYNAQGGLVHWTHHDPSGEHPTGWLKYDGTVSQ
jgi:hypothetical protein